MRRRTLEGGLLTGDELRAPRFGLLLVVLVLVSVALLVLSRLEHSYVRLLRASITETLSPVLAALQVPLEPVRWLARQTTMHLELAEDYERLKREAQEAESWKWRVRDLERQIADLARLNKVALEPVMPFITARVVATSTGAFAESAVVSAGRAHGVRTGYPVVSGDGLVGRIVETGEQSSRVLLLTDPMSRIPVHVGALGVRAVMTGDNGPLPRLLHLSERASVAAGEAVFTSGVGGLFPRGLRIGEVADTEHGVAVKLRADLAGLDYLSILFFETPLLELTDRTRGDPRRRDVATDLSSRDWPAVGTKPAIPLPAQRSAAPALPAETVR